MSAPFQPPGPCDDAPGPDGWERVLLDRQLAELGRLAAMGMDIAAEIHRRTTAADEGAPVAPLQQGALDFSRVARAVRLTFALQSRLIAEFKAPARAARAAADAEGGPVEYHWIGVRSHEEREQQRRIQLAVGRAAEAEALDAESVERLVLEAGERLDRDDIWRPLRSLAFDEIVAAICRDLGLKPDGGSPFADRASPRPLDGGVVGSGGDGSASVRPTGRPHPRPSDAFAYEREDPDQGGRESPQWASAFGDSS